MAPTAPHDQGHPVYPSPTRLDDLRYPNNVDLALPTLEDLADSEAPVNQVQITRPTRAFFLGCRRSLLITPQDLEAGLALHDNRSSTTLVADRSDDGNDGEREGPVEAQPRVRDRSLVLSSSVTLPEKKGPRIYRYLRWNFGSVYRRIFSLALLGNLVGIIFLLVHGLHTRRQLTYQTASIAVSANLLAAILARNEHVVNALFLLFGTWPRRAPLRFRLLFAKVYSYGGIHSGCSVAATLWYLVFLGLLTKDFISMGLSVLRGYLILVSYGIIFLLVSILIFAHPRLRAAIHNWFEGIHRFMGWTIILLFWAQIMLLTADSAASRSVPFGKVLVTSPPFWMILLTTLLVAYPWMRLRLRDVEAEVLSDHCVKLNFDYADVQYGQAVRLTDAPLRETHAFAVIPNPPIRRPDQNQEADRTPHLCYRCKAEVVSADISETPTAMYERGRIQAQTQTSQSKQAQPTGSPSTFLNPGKPGFSVLVSNAGDWTKKIISNPPKKIYTRGAPQLGVLRIAGLFSPCIVMATGSGIGPCLSLFVQKPNHPVRIIWSAPNPLKTYGQAVLDLIYKTDPDAIVVDTRKTGRPDLVRIAWGIWEASRKQRPVSVEKKKTTALGPCEAVVIISNQKVTKKVVYGLESRGVPAYGAIFDS